jgi:hypothetical protein
MADATVWSERVDAWRASGKTAVDFAAGRGFTAGTLRQWASRLGKKRAGKSSPSAFVQLVPRRRRAGDEGSAPPGVVTIEVGGARVIVHAGFDRGALRDVLAVLAEARWAK